MLFNKVPKNILKFVTPSTNAWKDGLVTGNGEVGLNVYGGPGREVVLVNNAKLCWKGYTGVLPDVSDKVKNIVKSLNESKYREAENTLTNALKAKNYKPELSYPLPLCDFVLKQNLTSSYNEYKRELNLENSEVSSEFKVKNIKFNREIFVATPSNIICYNVYCSGNKNLSGSFTINQHDLADSFDVSACEGVEVKLPFTVKTDKDMVIYTCRNEDGTDFGCVAKVMCFGGALTKDADTFYFKNADRIFIIAKTFVLGQKEKEIEKIKEEFSLFKNPYDKLLKENAVVRSKQFKKTEINLNGRNLDNMNLELLNLKTTSNLPLSLMENLYNYGKHLYLSLGSNFSMSCGLFNGNYKATESTTSNFLQLQRFVNFSFKAGLCGVVKEILERFYDNLDDYKKNATRIFGCKGIYIPSVESPESGLPGDTAPNVIMNYNVAAYVVSMIYKYYVLTKDEEFMQQKGFELVEETGFFYEDFLKENKTTNVFETLFGYSPFSTPSNIGITDGVSIANNCVADFACAKYVFAVLNELCLTLNKTDKELEKWQKLLDKIPDAEVDKDGILKEYNGKTFETNNHSPYIPHLFPYNIGLKTIENRRDFDELVANTVKHRFINSCGKFTSSELCDMATALATCGDGANSYEILSVIAKNFLRDNLVFDNYDFASSGIGVYKNYEVLNLDKNLGFCNAMQNLFVNSSKNNIYLFKTLPKVIQKGSVKNLMLDNNIKCDMDFNNKRGIVKVMLKANANMSVKVYLPQGFKKVKGVDATLVDNQYLCLNNLSLPENKVVTLKIYYKN